MAKKPQNSSFAIVGHTLAVDLRAPTACFEALEYLEQKLGVKADRAKLQAAVEQQNAAEVPDPIACEDPLGLQFSLEYLLKFARSTNLEIDRAVPAVHKIWRNLGDSGLLVNTATGQFEEHGRRVKGMVDNRVFFAYGFVLASQYRPIKHRSRQSLETYLLELLLQRFKIPPYPRWDKEQEAVEMRERFKQWCNKTGLNWNRF